jgi:hypothetical protein
VKGEKRQRSETYSLIDCRLKDAVFAKASVSAKATPGQNALTSRRDENLCLQTNWIPIFAGMTEKDNFRLFTRSFIFIKFFFVYFVWFAVNVF